MDSNSPPSRRVAVRVVRAAAENCVVRRNADFSAAGPAVRILLAPGVSLRTLRSQSGGRWLVRAVGDNIRKLLCASTEA